MWKKVVYDGYTYFDYECNEEGRVRSLNYKRTKTARVLSNNYDGSGYAVVWLFANGKKKRVKVSRIIAETFIPNMENKPFVDHIDTNKKNNSVSNLRWVTHKENCNNPITIQNLKLSHPSETARFYGCFGSEHNRSKSILCIDTGMCYGSIREAARTFGCGHQTIVSALKRRSKTAVGHRWAYVKEND